MPKDAYRGPDVSMSPHDRCLALHAALISDPDYTGFDIAPLKQSKLISASAETQSTKWSFTVTDNLCNKGGNLHGGCAATLLDSLTSTALLTVARPGFLDGGHVSRTLSCTYLRPVASGTECIVECWVVAAGKRTANVRGEIRTADGKVCVACVHDKAVLEKPQLSAAKSKL